MKEGQKVWLVKYALTDGITEEVVKSVQGEHVFLQGRSWSLYKQERDVLSTHGEALKAAEALRQKKLSSLRKQCMKLEKLKF